MTQTTEVEAVARAMHGDAMARNHDGDDYAKWEQTSELVREAWRHIARAAIAAIEEYRRNKTTGQVVECHEGTGLGELLSPEEGRKRLTQYGQIQKTAIEAFRARVEEAIIAEINDPKNAVESPQWRQGLRIARIILNREAEAVNNDAQP